MVFLLLTVYYDVYYVGFGLASHLGVLTDIPTIGVGKNMYFIDGMANDDNFKEKVSTLPLPTRIHMHNPLFNSQVRNLKKKGDLFDLIGQSGRRWGQV